MASTRVSLEKDRQSVVIRPVGSSQQKSGMLEYNCSCCEHGEAVVRRDEFPVDERGAYRNISAVQCEKAIDREYHDISRLKPTMRPFGPFSITGLSDPMKLPLGLINVRQ